MKKIYMARAEQKDGAFPSRRVSVIYTTIMMLIALVISACSASSGTPTPIPTLVLGGSNDTSPTKTATSNQSGKTTVASAVILPAQQADLAFLNNGNIRKINVSVGKQVKAGDVLVELDNTSAQLDVESAKRSLRELTAPAAIAVAEEAVANAQTDFDDAKKKLDSVKFRNSDNVTVNYLKDQVTLAQNALDHARDDYKKTGGKSNLDPVRAKAGTNLYNAQKAYNTALGNLNWYTRLPSENDIALATANFDFATATLQETKWYVSELKGEAIPAEATGAQLAQLQQARDNLQTAQDQLDQTRLIAPFDGTIAEVNVVTGEFVSPGKVILIISDLDHMQVKTTDLSERDIINVSIGDPAIVLIKALNEKFEAQVINISPLADTLGGDVVYEVTLSFTEQPTGVLAGMTADVTIGE